MTGHLAEFTITVDEDRCSVRSQIAKFVRPEYALWAAVGELVAESRSLAGCPYAHSILVHPHLLTVAEWMVRTPLPDDLREALSTLLRAASEAKTKADKASI